MGKINKKEQQLNKKRHEAQREGSRYFSLYRIPNLSSSPRSTYHLASRRHEINNRDTTVAKYFHPGQNSTSEFPSALLTLTTSHHSSVHELSISFHSSKQALNKPTDASGAYNASHFHGQMEGKDTELHRYVLHNTPGKLSDCLSHLTTFSALEKSKCSIISYYSVKSLHPK